MLSLLLASLVATSDPAPLVEAPRHTGPSLHCREMGSAASRSQAITICRTRAQWMKLESCQNVTRYCAPKKQDASMGRATAFSMNEDSRITCRILKVTGSRLRQSSVCMPNREWERMWKDSSDTTLDLQDKSNRMNEAPR